MALRNNFAPINPRQGLCRSGGTSSCNRLNAMQALSPLMIQRVPIHQ